MPPLDRSGYCTVQEVLFFSGFSVDYLLCCSQTALVVLAYNIEDPTDLLHLRTGDISSWVWMLHSWFGRNSSSQSERWWASRHDWSNWKSWWELPPQADSPCSCDLIWTYISVVFQKVYQKSPGFRVWFDCTLRGSPWPDKPFPVTKNGSGNDGNTGMYWKIYRPACRVRRYYSNFAEDM